MRTFRSKAILMSALGVALSSGAVAVASAFNRVEEGIVELGLRATHAITEQVCKFDTVDQLEAFLDGVADRHHWTRSDTPAVDLAPAAIAPDVEAAGNLVDTTASQYDALASNNVTIDLAQLRADVAADTAAETLADSTATETPAATVQPDTLTDTAA